MKKFEILQELPKCNTETRSESKCCWKNGINRLACHRVATNLQFVKNTIAVKHNKAKHDKKRYACICTPVFIAALFTGAKRWKQPKCLSADEWINKMCMHTMECMDNADGP